MEHPVYDAYMYMSYPNQRKYSQSWKNESGSFSSDNHSNESTSDRYQYFNEEISEDAKVDNVTPKSPSNSPTNINGIKDKDKEFVRKTTIPKQKMKLHISSIPQLSTYQYTPRRREIPTSLFEKRLSTNGLRPTITYNPGLKSSKFSPTRSPENESVLEKASLHWNERYQEILCREESHEKFEELVTHYNDFLKTAEIYGKIIISEFYLSPSEKTIKPHIIGQTPESNQFLVRGILFKSAHDSFTSFSSSLSHSNENIPLNHSTTSTFFSNFDSDNSPTCENYQFQNCVDHDILSHAANQQLKALQGFHNAQVDGISLPLTVVIDYCGIRLFAISVLPINIESLRYGSRGFGTIHTDDTTLNELMKSVATTLNIKGHVIRGNLLYAPADIEVYEGRDGRYYVLESTRLFPREAPSKFIKKEQSDGIFGLCADETKLDYVEKCEDCSLRCFRPEFVKQYKKALSPDAFSVFDHEDESMIENRKDVIEATMFLYVVVIPDFVKEIEMNKTFLDHQFDLSKTLHQSGINIRHIGNIWGIASSDDFKEILITECVTRAVKNEIKKLQRNQLKVSADSIQSMHTSNIKNVLLGFFNMLIGDIDNDEQTITFWNKTLPSTMEKMFPIVIHNKPLPKGKALMNLVQKENFFKMISKHTGIVFSEKSIEELVEDIDVFQFVNPDISKIKPLIKEMNIINIAEGSLYLLHSVFMNSIEDTARLIQLASVKGEKAMRRSIDVKSTMLIWCSILLECVKLCKSKEKSLLYLRMAEEELAKVKQIKSPILRSFEQFESYVFELENEVKQGL